MARKISMEHLANFLANQLEAIRKLMAEIEEIQVGFNSRYVEFKAEHDHFLLSLSERALADVSLLGKDLQDLIEERRHRERETLLQRRRALREVEVPAARTEADERLNEARRLEAELRRANPVWDQKEEKLKSELGALHQQLAGLNQEIAKARRGLGFLFRVGQITALDRERQKVLGTIGAVRQQLNEVRVEWNEKLSREADARRRLQEEWGALTVKAAQLQSELDFLDDERQLEELALRRAVAATLDNLKDPELCRDGVLGEELGQMVRLNIQTDNLEEGLKEVAGIIALLRGITVGLTSFKSSVDAILAEQRMHSAHLRPVSLSLPDVVEKFHSQWEPLRRQIQDEKRLSRYPLEFIAAVKPVLKDGLSPASVERMFQALGAELSRATAQWRG